MWSVRMRASKTVKREALSVKSRKIQNSKSKNQNSSQEIHISGAEGLYELPEVDRIAKEYFIRAMKHPKGMPDKVVITLEKVKQKPREVPILKFVTVQCNCPCGARKIISGLLSAGGVSDKAIRKSIRVVTSLAAMHGAALISCGSAARIETDKQRGIRVSRLGIDKESERRLQRRLSRSGINTPTVREALILASKVASCKGVVAELCISDDPDYTTGYVASGKLGYVRIPNIKEKGSSSGGRVFFVKDGADVERMIEYLERRPVVVGM